MLRKSTYVLELPLNDGSNKSFVIMSTLNAEPIKVNGKLLDVIKNNPETLNSNVKRTLLKKGILVDLDVVDERNRLFGKAKFPEVFSPILAYTTYCNLACTYCYEEGVPYKTMNKETIDLMVNWIEAKASKEHYKKIHPILFGGEPFAPIRIAYKVMEKIQKVGERLNKPVTFGASTNGLKLNRENTIKLRDLGLVSAQISLDGDEAIHNMRRIGHKGEGTFNQILNVITDIMDIINITIKVNLDKQNMPFVQPLIEKLALLGLQNYITLHFEAVVPTPASKNQPIHHCNSYTYNPKKKELADAYINCFEIAKEHGFKVAHHSGLPTPCMIIVEDSVLIDPEGDLYKCISSVGIEEFKVGNVRDVFYNSRYKEFMDLPELMSECEKEECPFIPLCARGCAFDSFVETGKFQTRQCKKEFMREFVPKLMELANESPIG